MSLASKVFVGLAIFFAMPLSVSAQEAGIPQGIVILADVNIHDVSSVRTDDGYDVSFTIKNRMGVQSDIRYGLELVSNEGVVSTYVSDEVLTLREGESVRKTIRYTAPPHMKGAFSATLMSENSRGLLLATIGLGTFEFAGKDGVFVLSDESDCNLRVEGQNDPFLLTQGVDIRPTEKLFLSCSLVNKGRAETRLIPFLRTYKRTVFGDLVREQSLDAISVSSGSAPTAFSLHIPTIGVPQSYEARLVFKNDRGEAVSGEIGFRYVMTGESATIQNLTLDKTGYKAGETALAKLFWSPSADSFPGSRFGGTDLRDDKAVAAVSLTSGGRACSSIVRRDLPSSDRVGDLIVDLSIPVTADCPNPEAAITVSDANGKVLDSQSIAFIDKNASATNDEASASANGSSPYFLGVVLISLIGFLILAVHYYRKRRNHLVISLLFLVPLGFGALMPTEARAITIAGWTGEWTTTINFDKPAYAPGENIGLSVTTNTWLCANSAERSRFHLSHNDGALQNLMYITSIPSHLKAGGGKGFGFLPPGLYTGPLTGSDAATASQYVYRYYSSKYYRYSNFPYTVSNAQANVGALPALKGKLYIESIGPGVYDYRTSGSSYAGTIWYDVIPVPTGPTVPTITPDPANTGLINQPQSFTFFSTDPNNDTFRYGVDWDNNGSLDQWVPGAGYVNSGTAQSASRTWTTPGTYTFRAFAEDSGGAQSGWQNHTIVITPPPSVFSLCTAGGVPIASTPGVYSRSLAVPGSESFFAYYDATPNVCGDTAPVTDGLWTDTASPAVTITGATASPQTITAVSGGSDTVTVSRGPSTITFSYTVSVPCSPTATCGGQSGDYCEGQPFTIPDNGCGSSLNCTGTRYCDFNWKETTPGN